MSLGSWSVADDDQISAASHAVHERRTPSSAKNMCEDADRARWGLTTVFGDFTIEAPEAVVTRFRCGAHCGEGAAVRAQRVFIVRPTRAGRTFEEPHTAAGAGLDCCGIRLVMMDPHVYGWRKFPQFHRRNQPRCAATNAAVNLPSVESSAGATAIRCDYADSGPWAQNQDIVTLLMSQSHHRWVGTRAPTGDVGLPVRRHSNVMALFEDQHACDGAGLILIPTPVRFIYAGISPRCVIYTRVSSATRVVLVTPVPARRGSRRDAPVWVNSHERPAEVCESVALAASSCPQNGRDHGAW